MKRIRNSQKFKLILALLKTFASIVITDDDNKSHQSHKINTHTNTYANIIKQSNAIEILTRRDHLSPL